MKSPLAALVLLLAAGTASAQVTPTPASLKAEDHARHVIVELPDAIKWVPAPASLPAGARVALLEGDPSKPGPFTMRLWMPDGYRIPPHFHPSNERVTVISGTFLVGTGEKLDLSKAATLPTGTYAALSPGMPHFAQARGETVIQLNNVGPWGLTYVNPADDPRNAKP
jgi:anti-sigma factor ChrR (cupin superfamily)